MGSRNRSLNRREFIQAAGSIAASRAFRFRSKNLSLIVDPADPVANAAPSRWAADELERSLSSRMVTVQRRGRLVQTQRDAFCIIAAGAKSTAAAEVFKRASTALPDAPEALGLIPANFEDRRTLLACSHDTRGLAYALLELSDRVQHSIDALEALSLREPIIERPANAIRSVLRLFASDVEDKPWYYDREMWPRYLTMLATLRFNRFNLSLSLGYDFLRQVTDAYFLFPYPFLLAVPGYNVRATPLPDAERDRNLEMLKFISEQTVARGMQFQLGLWMHGYEWINSPQANYRIEGLTQAKHGPYCRDALRLLLQRCPAITGVTIRTHGESGVEEGSYDFWKTIFDGVASCGRKVEIDLHPKGLDQTMMDNALATGQPITVSPKFWAEHLGMPYHQADIRQLEIPPPGKQPTGLMKLSTGSRSFLRYGYGDLLREDRSWRVVHRIWPGSQRLLLWGDPTSAAAYARAFQFCGSDGAEICEPLTFKGRRGSGIAEDRCGYADPKLRPKWDWQKYEYTYRVWGRLLYNPDSSPEPWRRWLTHKFGRAAGEIESALANASRILPIVTTAHCPSAANNSYWPEMYLNHSLIDAAHPGPYGDTPSPKVFGNVSPLDPQFFSRINDFADELIESKSTGKYSPIEVAQWLEDYGEAAKEHLAQAALQMREKDSSDYRRLTIDVAIQAGLGRFFAAKFRSGVLYRIFEKTGERQALQAALDQYRKARGTWAEFADAAKSVYFSDITVGELPQLRGHWLDRLSGIDRDIAALTAKLEGAKPGESPARADAAIKEVLAPARREVPACEHTPPVRFVPGQPQELMIETKAASVTLYYRHVNQAERFTGVAMQQLGDRHRATIPAVYNDSFYPLEYYFEVRAPGGKSNLYPGFSKNLTNQPYFVVRRG